MGPEAGLRARILHALRHTPGVRVWGWPASAFTGAGHPDLFGAARGRFFGLEVKTRTGRLTMRQQLALRDIRKAGGYAWEVRTVQQAERALAWILEGRHPPMASDAFNIDDWFKDLDKPAEAAAEAQVETLPWDDVPAPEPTHEELLQNLDARADALDGKPSVADAVAMRDAQQPVGVSQSAVDDFIALVHKIDADVRAAGDRTTLVYEELHSLRLELNITRNMVQALERNTRQLIALISEDEELPEVPVMPEAPEPEPAPKRRSRRAS